MTYQIYSIGPSIPGRLPCIFIYVTRLDRMIHHILHISPRSSVHLRFHAMEMEYPVVGLLLPSKLLIITFPSRIGCYDINIRFLYASTSYNNLLFYTNRGERYRELIQIFVGGGLV